MVGHHWRNGSMKNLHRRASVHPWAIVAVAMATLGAAGGLYTTATAAQKPLPQGSADTATLPVDVQKALGELKNVTPGAGLVPASAYLANGTQTYTCTSAGVWPTSGSVPEATLVRRSRRGDTIHHYGGPRWEAADGSILRGVLPPRSQVAKSGTIPWLHLNVTHEGTSGALAPVTNISRILTSGGLPPASACVPGTTTSPAYKAVYVFWVPGPQR
jgi:hypothetical protein